MGNGILFLCLNKFYKNMNGIKSNSDGNKLLLLSSVKNIGFDGYIGTWILRIYWIYWRYIGGYFYMNIDI